MQVDAHIGGVIEIDVFGAAAAFGRPPAPRVIDQDAPHRLRRRAVEMHSVLKVGRADPHQT